MNNTYIYNLERDIMCKTKKQLVDDVLKFIDVDAVKLHFHSDGDLCSSTINIITFPIK